MKNVLHTAGLTFKTVFKIHFIGFFFSVGLFLFFNAISSLFRYDLLFLFTDPLLGWRGFGFYLVLMPAMSFAYALPMTLITWIGLLIYTLFSSLTIEYKK